MKTNPLFTDLKWLKQQIDACNNTIKCVSKNEYPEEVNCYFCQATNCECNNCSVMIIYNCHCLHIENIDIRRGKQDQKEWCKNALLISKKIRRILRIRQTKLIKTMKQNQ